MAHLTPPPTRRETAEVSQLHPLLTTNEAAAALNQSRRTIQERCADGSLAFIKIGRSIRFHRDDIAAFIEKNRRKAVGWKGGIR